MYAKQLITCENSLIIVNDNEINVCKGPKSLNNVIKTKYMNCLQMSLINKPKDDTGNS